MTQQLPRAEPALRLADAAERFDLSLRTLSRWVRQGEVPAHKVRGLRSWEWRVHPADLARHLAGQGSRLVRGPAAERA